MDIKSHAHTIAKRLINEIDLLKRDRDKTFMHTKDSLNENNNECSGRANYLYKYIEEQVSGNNEVIFRKYENIKTVISKPTDQFKSHLVFHDEQLKNIQNRIKLI